MVLVLVFIRLGNPELSIYLAGALWGPLGDSGPYLFVESLWKPTEFRSWGGCWHRVGVYRFNIRSGSQQRQGTWAFMWDSLPSPRTLSDLAFWTFSFHNTSYSHSWWMGSSSSLEHLLPRFLAIAGVSCSILPPFFLSPSYTPWPRSHKFLISPLASLIPFSFLLSPHFTSMPWQKPFLMSFPGAKNW